LTEINRRFVSTVLDRRVADAFEGLQTPCAASAIDHRRDKNPQLFAGAQLSVK
jgi:hypothetical protein